MIGVLQPCARPIAAIDERRCEVNSSATVLFLFHKALPISASLIGFAGVHDASYAHTKRIGVDGGETHSKPARFATGAVITGCENDFGSVVNMRPEPLLIRKSRGLGKKVSEIEVHEHSSVWNNLRSVRL